MCSLVYGDVLKVKDTIIQIARCSFDVHVQEILGTLATGATLVMLHQGGIIDPKYLADIIKKRTLRALLLYQLFFNFYLVFCNSLMIFSTLMSLRGVCTGGM